MDKKRPITIFLAVVTSFASFLTSPLVSEAAYRRAHSSVCHPDYDNYGPVINNGHTIHNKSTTPKWFFCPVVTDGYLPHNTVTRLNVHGYEPPGVSNKSRACVKDYNNSVIVCGPYKEWGPGYTGVNDVSVTEWSDSLAFPYLVNELGAGGRLYGFFIAN